MKFFELMRLFDSIGVRFHDFWDTHNDKKRVTAHCFKCDRLTPAQREALTQRIQGVQFVTASPQFAPEIRRAVIVIPARFSIA